MEKASEQLIELTLELEMGKNLGVLSDPTAMVLDIAAVSGHQSLSTVSLGVLLPLPSSYSIEK